MKTSIVHDIRDISCSVCIILLPNKPTERNKKNIARDTKPQSVLFRTEIGHGDKKKNQKNYFIIDIL